MVKRNQYEQFVAPFIAGVLFIAIYKLLDSTEYVLYGIGAILKVLYPIILAFVIAFVLYPLCKKTESFFAGAKPELISARARVLSVVVVYATAMVLIALIFYIIVPTLAESITSFARSVPDIVTSVLSEINRYPYFNVEPSKVFEHMEKYLASSPLARPEVYTTTFIEFSGWLVNAILSVIMSVYILLDRESLVRWGKFFAGIFIPAGGRKIIGKYALRCVVFVQKYIYCSLIDASIIFALSFLVLLVLKVRYAPTLALMIGIFNLVPYFGSIIASIVAISVTLITSGVAKGVTVGICLLILQQLDGNVIHPFIIKESLAIKPFWVLAGLFVGGGFFGIWGIVLSVPALALAKSIFCDFVGSKVSEKS